MYFCFSICDLGILSPAFDYILRMWEKIIDEVLDLLPELQESRLRNTVSAWVQVQSLAWENPKKQRGKGGDNETIFEKVTLTANFLKKELHKCPKAKREETVSSRQRIQYEERHRGSTQKKGV